MWFGVTISLPRFHAHLSDKIRVEEICPKNSPPVLRCGAKGTSKMSCFSIKSRLYLLGLLTNQRYRQKQILEANFALKTFHQTRKTIGITSYCHE